MSKNVRLVLVIFLLILTPVFWQSCTGALTPEDIIARAHWTMNTVGSYHMANYYTASENITEYVNETYVDVEFSFPDRYRATLKGGGITPEPIIVIGDEYFVYTEGGNYGSDDEISAAAYALIQSLKRESFFSYLDFLIDVEGLTAEDIEGIDCYHLTAAWDKEKQLENYSEIIQQQRRDNGLPEYSEEELAESIEYVSDMLEEVTLEFEFWVDKDDLYIRKLTMYQKQVSETQYGTIEYVTDATMDFSMINEPITIGPPLDEYGLLQAGWLQATYE